MCSLIITRAMSLSLINVFDYSIWIILNLLLDVLVCSIASFFLLAVCILTDALWACQNTAQLC